MGYTGEKKRAYQLQWMQNRRQSWIDENGPCVDCGSTENLEVDHVDAKTKQYNPARIWSRRKEIRDAELSKCVVRCYSCHKAKTLTESPKITIDIANEIRDEYSRGNQTHRKLAEKYNLSYAMIGSIIRYECWK